MQETGAGRTALGEILIFFDADNGIDPNFLQNVIKQTNSSLSAGCFYTIPESNSWKDHALFNFLHLLKICGGKPHGKCFLTKNLFDKLGGWNERIKIGTTVDFNSHLKRACQKEGLNYAVTNIKIKASLRRFKNQGYLSVLWVWVVAYFGLRNRWYDNYSENNFKSSTL